MTSTKHFSSDAGAQPPFPKTAAEVFPVREITLLAEADWEPWAKRLKAEEQQPVRFDQKARLLLSATDARFRGVRFREFSVSILVDSAEDRPAVFMLQAFNSVRFFAWVERTVFRTPYCHARIEVDVSRPTSVRVKRKSNLLATLKMAGQDQTATLRSGDETWEGVVYLPSGKGNQAARKKFYARLSGPAEVYACRPADQMEFHKTADIPSFSEIAASNLQGIEWLIRDAGRHMKSKTVPTDWSGY